MKKPTENTFLSECFKRSGKTRLQFCAAIGMSESSYCRYASDAYRVRADMLPQLAAASGLDKDELFNLIWFYYGKTARTN